LFLGQDERSFLRLVRVYEADGNGERRLFEIVLPERDS
jgi:hypothetical protein